MDHNNDDKQHYGRSSQSSSNHLNHRQSNRMRDQNFTSPTSTTSKYELHHSVSELFSLLNVCEGKNFNKETISERFEKNINRQSSKPFSLFFNRLADNQNFIEKYQPIKCRNSNDVDSFVRFLVRVREDKTMSNFLNNYDEISKNKIKFTNNMAKPSTQNHSQRGSSVHNRSTASSSAAKTRPTSATSNLLNMFNQIKPETSKNFTLQKSNTMGPIMKPLRPLNMINVNANANVPNLVASPVNRQLDYDLEIAANPKSHSTSNYNSLTTPSPSSHYHNHQHQSGRKVPPYMSRDFHPCDWPKENDCFNTLGTYPVQEQEQLLLRDLLFVLIGIEGRFIRLHRPDESSCYKLVLDPTTDHFLTVTTNRILKICYHYSAIVTYVESRVYGLVSQALVASIHQHLYDYNMTICQMEESLMKNDLFLQKMFFILLPYFSTFSLLREICVKLHKNKSVGGVVLTLLHEKTKSIQGMDNNALELCLVMTKSAAIPYFEIMKTWIYYGEIGDPRKEFFIEDTHNNHSNSAANGNISGLMASGIAHQNQNDDIESDDEYDDDFGKFNDKYWDVRYRLNPSKTPCFLKKHEQIIYKTGKYVSIINKVKQLFMKSSKVIPIPQSLNPNGGTATIQSAASINTETIRAPTSAGSFMFVNNVYQHHMGGLDNNSIGSMASSSSSNTSHSTTGRGTTPAPSAAIFTPKPEEIYYSFDESTYLSPIVSAYEEASSQLLHILIHESQLVETFNAVKHYMLLSMGDFIVHFMKFASKDLCKRTDSVVQHRLDSMMGMALGISVCHSDRQYLKDDPHVEFVGKSFLKQIYQIMKPFNESNVSLMNNSSPSSSYLLRCDDDAIDEDDEGDGDVALDRSIISSVIEAEAANDETASEVDSNKIRTNKYLGSGGCSSRMVKNEDTKIDPKKQSPNKAATECSQRSPKAITSRKLFCYESLMLKFDVPFPLSLIFTQKSIVCYELLFRYVFLCRYAEMELEETWKDNILNVKLRRCDTLSLLNQLTNLNVDDQPKPSSSDTTTVDQAHLLAKAFKNIHKKAFALRYKMIAFVRNFHYFYAFEVIDPFFAQFIAQITKRGSSLDSVIECHEKFLENCFSSCFLTSIEITTIIVKIFTLCIELSHVLRDSIDVEDQSSLMESSCFFGSDAIAFELYNNRNNANHTKNEDNFIHDKLNKIYFSNRIFGFNSDEDCPHSAANNKNRKSTTIIEIIDNANTKFDTLVSQLLKKIYSDNCEYHMMYPFVARLDYNDFYRSQMLET